jgi:hypothetical protein
VDLHRLFDKYLLTIEPETRKVLIPPELMNSYKDILGKTLETRICGEDAINHKYVLDREDWRFEIADCRLFLVQARIAQQSRHWTQSTESSLYITKNIKCQAKVEKSRLGGIS